MTNDKRQAVEERIRELVPETLEFVEVCLKGTVYIAEPIQLHHVLMALQAVKCQKAMDCEGYIYRWYGAGWDFREARWNLHDPLSGQPEEVWEFLYNALIDKA